VRDAGRYVFVTSCLDARGIDIREMLDAPSDQKVSLETFRKAVGPAGWKWIQNELGFDRNLPISKDRHLRFARAVFRGVPAYYVNWSGIEFIFTLDGEYGEREDPWRRDVPR